MLCEKFRSCKNFCGLFFMSSRTRRTNPTRAARSPNTIIDSSDSEESGASEESHQSSFFSPADENRGCPICRDVPTYSLRIFPDVFKCSVCLSEDISLVFAFVPCGHCLCGDCKNSWMISTESTLSLLPDIANLNISDNQVAASGRRGRPLMSPHERSAESTRRRKKTIITAVENWQFNNGIVLDGIFYCDIPETFESPDEEPREVFRQRLTDAMNTEANGDFECNDNSWVIALIRLSAHFEGENPLEFVRYTISMQYGDRYLTLTVGTVKGLKDKDLIASLTENDYEEVKILDPTSQEDRTKYFANCIKNGSEHFTIVQENELLNPHDVL